METDSEEILRTQNKEIELLRKNMIKNIKLIMNDIETVINLSILGFYYLLHKEYTKEHIKNDQRALLKVIKNHIDLKNYYQEWTKYLLTQYKRDIEELSSWKEELLK